MTKKTKIVATIGPASESQKMLRALIKAGMNVCRLNFSHGDYSWHKRTISRIRKAAMLEKTNVAIIADIQGPRIRVASQKNIQLKRGEVVFVTDEVSTQLHQHKNEIVLDWKGFYKHVSTNDKIYIEDGIISLQVTAKKKGGCVAKVLEPGLVKPRKGVNIPSISAHMGFLTPKDVNDLDFILTQGVEYVAVSFVGNKSDLLALRGMMEKWKKKQDTQLKLSKTKTTAISLPLVISKIEKEQAVEHLVDIIHHSDGIMVARGDLAIEMPQEKVTLFQKNIIKSCLKLKKPVIVATQMMNSMIDYPRPTRAEIADVTNAVIDQADAVMLSGESAQGKYPEKVVDTMTKIIEATEKSPYNDVILKTLNKFARMIIRAKRATTKKKSVIAKSYSEAVHLAALRQESVSIKIKSRNKQDEIRGSLVWGVE